MPISLLADIQYRTGAPEIRTENGQLVGFVFVDITSSDINGYVNAASQKIDQEVKFPPGYYIQWAGQFQYLQEAEKRLSILIPFTLLIIFVLIYMNTIRSPEDIYCSTCPSLSLWSERSGCFTCLATT